MTEFPYGRVNAIESALGGRAAAIVPVGWGYIPRASAGASLLSVIEQPLG